MTVVRPQRVGVTGLPVGIDALLRFQQTLLGELNRRLQAEASLSLVQYQFLHAVATLDVATLSAVAQLLGCTRGNVTGLADRLMKQVLLGRQINPDDRRSCFLALTQEGRQRLDRAKQVMAEYEKELRRSGRAAEELRRILALFQAEAVPAPGSRAAADTYPPPEEARDAAITDHVRESASSPRGSLVVIPRRKERVVVVHR